MTASKFALPPLIPSAHSTASNHTPSKPITKRPSRSPLSESQKWHHLSTRTPAITPFIYAVLTTKIYCLPTCPSRLARRANIVFLSTPQEAERDGFRACKRCKPDLSPSFLPVRSGNPPTPKARDSTTSNDSPAGDSPVKDAANASDQTITTLTAPEFDPTDPSLKLHQAISLVKARSLAGEKISLALLAQEVGLSKWHLQRAFKRRCGRSPREMGEALLSERNEQARIDEGSADGPGAARAAKINGSMNMSTEASRTPGFDPLPALPTCEDTITARNRDTDLNLWNTNIEASSKLDQTTPDWELSGSTATSSSAPGFTASDRLTESTSSFATTPAPPTDFSPIISDMDFTYNNNFYPSGFSPDVEDVLKDLFPEIYDQNMIMESHFSVPTVERDASTFWYHCGHHEEIDSGM